MHLLLGITVLALASFGWVTAGDQYIDNGLCCVKALGRSGKLLFGRAGQCTAKGVFSGVTVDFKELKELAADGKTVVGTTGKAKHSFNTFASQDFRVSAVTRGVALQNLIGDTFTFSGQLKNLPSTLSVNAYLVTSCQQLQVSGNWSTGVENIYVQPGSIIFTMELTNWKFCGTGPADDTCKKGRVSEIGAFVDFSFSLTAPKPAKYEVDDENSGIRYTLGDLDLSLSEMVVKDGNTEQMIDGFPQLKAQGKSNTYTFRFRRFATKTTYVAVIGPPHVDPIDVITGAGGKGHSNEKSG